VSFIEKRNFVHFSTIGAILAWSYLIALDGIGDSRIIDARLTGGEMYWWEFIITGQAALLIFITAFSSMRHAFKSNRNKWGLVIILAWPLSYIYAWKFGRKI
jgi:hypothetical protein